MTEHDSERNRTERREDITAAINKALPGELDKALPGALDQALPKALEKAMWGDMRPARTWADMRSLFEGAMKDQEKHTKRMEGLQKRSFEIGFDLLKTAILHLAVSVGIFGIVWQFILHGARP